MGTDLSISSTHLVGDCYSPPLAFFDETIGLDPRLPSIIERKLAGTSAGLRWLRELKDGWRPGKEAFHHQSNSEQ
jgi:hypothetical protein